MNIWAREMALADCWPVGTKERGRGGAIVDYNMVYSCIFESAKISIASPSEPVVTAIGGVHVVDFILSTLMI